jgi:hypothetical protein
MSFSVTLASSNGITPVSIRSLKIVAYFFDEAEITAMIPTLVGILGSFLSHLNFGST